MWCRKVLWLDPGQRPFFGVHLSGVELPGWISGFPKSFWVPELSIQDGVILAAGELV